MTPTEVMELAAELERMTKDTALAVPPGSSGLAGCPRDWAQHVLAQPEWCKALYSVLRSAEMRLQAEATAVERTTERDRAERALADAHRVCLVSAQPKLDADEVTRALDQLRTMGLGTVIVDDESWADYAQRMRMAAELALAALRSRKDRDLFDAEIMLSDALAGEGPNAS